VARVTEEVVTHVARLARLELTDDERRLFTRQLADVLAYAESLQALDLDGVEPWRGTLGGVLREDDPRDGLTVTDALAAAPDTADRLFRVPRVLPG
jgi:aspartyl-tRNA(Asn)/glutamyl-tRNA(Gln) amidotransferase subunit C